jgi:hypothetical protein
MMIWGDILARHPEIIPRLPRDIVILPWGYWHRWSGRAVRPLVQAGLEVALCPGTNSWHALSPWVPVANVNIISAARAAQESRALGLLVTDWGDGGHQQPLGLSEHAFALGAEAAWNAGRTPILQEERIFCENVFGEGRLTAARLWRALGEANAALAINTGGWDPPNQKSIHIDSWYTINFFLFFLEHSLEGRWFSQVRPSGVRRLARLAAIARRCLDELEARAKGPVLLRRELSYSVGQLEHLAKRLTWMLELKRAKQRRSDLMRHAEWLVRDIRRLSKEFSELWRTRNKPLGQKTTLRLYSQAERFYLGELRRLRA